MLVFRAVIAVVCLCISKSKVKCNFVDMASVYCAGFDLRAELEKGSVSSETSLIPKRNKRRAA